MAIAILHKGREGCGEVAFYYDHMPVAAERLDSRYATTTDGKRIEPCSVIKCGTCGHSIISQPHVSWAVEVDTQESQG